MRPIDDPSFGMSEYVIEGGAATEVEGTFRVNGSNKRMRELQAAFESPPRVRANPSHFTPSFLITRSIPHSHGTPCWTSQSTKYALSIPFLLASNIILGSMGRTLNGRKSSTQHTMLQAYSDDTSLKCPYV